MIERNVLAVESIKQIGQLETKLETLEMKAEIPDEMIIDRETGEGMASKGLLTRERKVSKEEGVTIEIETEGDDC